jgi:integrase/recombinase XerC
VTKQRHGALLVKDDGGKLYPMMVNRIVKKYLKSFSSVEKKSPHVLRHTYATHLLNKGAELNAVKDLLGHSSLAATQVYTHNTIEKLKKTFDQAHPKA